MKALVIGAGVVGLAAGFELTRAGHQVTVLSAHPPGSRQSAGLSRIFRLAHADGELTDAAARSLELWREWEELVQAPLLDRVGLLLTGNMADRAAHLEAHGGLQQLTGAAHPLAVAQDDWSFELTGAAIRAEDTVRILQTGYELVLGEVTAVDAGGATLSTGERIDADAVAVCAGPDTHRLMGLPEPQRLRSVRFSFAVREPLENPAPCWIHRDDSVCEPFYAVMDGPQHYSIGLSQAGPAELPEAEHVRDAHRRITAIVTEVFPGLHPIAERLIACEYPVRAGAGQDALAHDGWDMPEHEGVLGVTGPSLFKFAPLLGQLVTQRLSPDQD